MSGPGERAQFIEVGPECAPGDFMANVAPDVRRRATTIDAVAKPVEALSAECAPANTRPSTGELIGSMAAVLQYVREYGRLTSMEHEMVAAAVQKYERWAADRVPAAARSSR